MNPSIPLSSDEARYSLAAGVLLQRFDEKALLIDLTRECVYQLNETGVRVAELLAEGKSPGEILVVLQAEYDALITDLERDVRELMIDLLENNLLIPQTI